MRARAKERERVRERGDWGSGADSRGNVCTENGAYRINCYFSQDFCGAVRYLLPGAVATGGGKKEKREKRMTGSHAERDRESERACARSTS